MLNTRIFGLVPFPLLPTRRPLPTKGLRAISLYLPILHTQELDSLTSLANEWPFSSWVQGPFLGTRHLVVIHFNHRVTESEWILVKRTNFYELEEVCVSGIINVIVLRKYGKGQVAVFWFVTFWRKWTYLQKIHSIYSHRCLQCKWKEKGSLVYSSLYYGRTCRAVLSLVLPEPA